MKNETVIWCETQQEKSGYIKKVYNTEFHCHTLSSIQPKSETSKK